MNKKYYITITIILIIYVIMIVTGGILIGPTEMERIPSYGHPGLSPAVLPKETKILIVNILIMITAVITNIFFIINDKKNKIKKMGLLLIILLSIFFVPIKIKGYGYIGGTDEYITIWNMIY